MKFRSSLLFSLLGIMACLQPLQAQITSIETMKAAAAFRADLAVAVAKNAETIPQALKRLKEQPTASGLSTLSPSEDQAQAALDIAYQLMGMERPDAAEYFFRAAEQDLVLATRGNTEARRKASYLKTLAIVRSRYLNKLDLARNDLAEAARLQPDDESIAKLARHLKQRSEGVGKHNPGH